MEEIKQKGVDIVQPLCYYISVNNRENKSRRENKVMKRTIIASLLRRGELEKAMDKAVRLNISVREFNKLAKRFYNEQVL